MLARDVRMVTFDVFDTLLWRTTLFPSDAFLLLGRRPGPATARARRWAETAASLLSRRLIRREPGLNDIYRLLPMAMGEELQIEHAIARANPFCLSLAMKLQQQGLAVAAISDMYLSSDQIASILRKAGFPGMPVYSSASAHATKFIDGRLFRHVWAQHQVSPRQVVHVGDNPHADIHMAAALGARTCLVRPPRHALFACHPALNRPSRSIQQSQYWGELAIRLHTRLGDQLPPGQDRLTDDLANALATFADAIEQGAAIPLDDAWQSLNAICSRHAASEAIG